MEELRESVINGDWEKALSILVELIESGPIDETTSILGATIMEHYAKWDMMFQMISTGLKLNPRNYELYLLLGNYYRGINPDLTFLSYENALYYSRMAGGEESEDTSQIQKLLEDFKANNNYSVNNVTFVILSYNTRKYTELCLNSIREYCNKESYEIIVVDNHSEDGSVEWLRQQKDIILIENKENRGFPAACNQGIDAANPDNDIFLLNNDTIMTLNALFQLRMGLYSDAGTGAVGAVTNYSGNGQTVITNCTSIEEYLEYAKKNNIPEEHPYENKTMLVMFAMLIKRTACNEVGKLDERFSPGNYEDNDYGLRLLRRGFRCVLCHNAFIYHFGSVSFGDNAASYKALLEKNRDKLKNKWGFDSCYYTNPRREVIDMIPAGYDESISVLEIGCGLGETLEKIRYMYPNSKVKGIEIVDKVVELGSQKLNIVQGDIEMMDLSNEDKYDYIIMADVVEHLREPEKVLNKIKSCLKQDGYVIFSIPNLMNAGVIYDLLVNGNFTYCEAGILDRTHLRFFTRNEILRLLNNNGYILDEMRTVSFDNANTTTYQEFFDKLLQIDGVAEKELFDTYQFLVRASLNRFG